MRRLLHLMLLLFLAFSAARAPACAQAAPIAADLASPIASAHHPMPHRHQAPVPHPHELGHVCIGCAAPVADLADVGPALRLSEPGLSMMPPELRPGRSPGMEPPPPRA